eukprot:CAMPEP_0113541748 /NCGR_PEP_ID=MMETSP0015_2-20120614/9213_1 /TAXON_ID=2838 /ORGANISM="Odontella" /LENGTH=535 /DNA_ID=CAMNT_0000441707 /DNA_START=700 /DNA_END=2308 /DNA_ORIENTATION=- /assembly_acc=CAM_ASM_000160
MAEDGSSAGPSAASPAIGSSMVVRRAFVLAMLVSVAASSPSASAPGMRRASSASTAATCCFVIAERPVMKGQKFRRRQRDTSDVAQSPPPSSSCPHAGQLLVPPSTSQLSYRSEWDVGTELTVPPSLVAKNKRKDKKGSWFKFSKRNRALATIDEDEYERRKLEWAAKYTDVSTLRESFGTNKNKLWGDFDPETTRKLYHTLLPRALMALNDLGVMTEQELAPLAYEARCAAKKYARERCVVPGRIFAMAYDGFRSWRDHGKWNTAGMTWDQVWEKYERQITDELDDADADADELTRQICLRILERSCRTNPNVDKIFLGDEHSKKSKKPSKSDIIKRRKQMDIASISVKLERDVHELLFEGAQKSILFGPTTKEEARRERRRLRRRMRRERKKNRLDHEVTEGEETGDLEVPEHAMLHDEDEEPQRRSLSAKDIAILRKIAEAKKKVIAVLQSERLVQMQLRQEMQKQLRQEERKSKAKGNYEEDQGEQLKIFSSDLAAAHQGDREPMDGRKCGKAGAMELRQSVGAESMILST